MMAKAGIELHFHGVKEPGKWSSMTTNGRIFHLHTRSEIPEPAYRPCSPIFFITFINIRTV